MSQFTRRLVSDSSPKLKYDFRLFHKLALLTMVLSSYFAFASIQESFMGSPAYAAEALRFAQLLPQKNIVLPNTGDEPVPGGLGDEKYGPEALPKKELVRILKEAGFEGESLKTAYAVARGESSGRPRAFNGNLNTGDNSYGVFQINMLGRLGPARRKQFGLGSNDELYDPVKNAKAAYAISSGGKNWRPWGAFTNSSYKKHLIDL